MNTMTGAIPVRSDLPYRPCVGILLFSRTGDVFVGRRNDVSGNAWQMPQGGIDMNENPRSAAIRELYEETGVRSVEVIGESGEWFTYNYPKDIARRSFAKKFRGQRQKWFAMRFLGPETEIDLGFSHAEFDAWKWVNLDCLPDLIVDFKKPVYTAVVAEFRDLARPME